MNILQRFGARVLRAALSTIAIFLIAGMIIIGSLRWIDPPTSSIIFQHNVFNKDESVSFNWRDAKNISSSMKLAVIAAEDQRFLQHYGLDFVEISNTLRARKNRPRGASTITQQVAKNMFLWSGRSYPRKIIEAALAVYIDFVWGKRRVLEIYLNVAQFGPGIYGVENAAQHFYNQPAANINRRQAARLAAVLPSPNRRSVAHASDTVVRRQQWILRQMKSLGGEQFIKEL